MKIGNRIRGPRLGTKLMLWGLVLLIVPWISYRQLIGMERLLIQGQSQAQLLTAEGISTLFNGREDLFNDLPIRIEDYESLYARPLQNPIRIDGKDSDWEPDIADKFIKFGVDAENDLTDGGFKILARRTRRAAVRVHVGSRTTRYVYRNPEYLRLDNADNVRLNFIQDDGEDGRVVITFTGPGVTTAYRVGPEWKLAVYAAFLKISVQGHMERTAERHRRRVSDAARRCSDRASSSACRYVDVDDPETRAIRAITQTLPTAGKSSFNLVVLRSPEVLNIIQGLGYSGARILVIDAQNRVRAETGTFTMSEDREVVDPGWSSTARRWFDVIRPVVHRLVMWQRWDDDELSERLRDRRQQGDRVVAAR